MSDKTIEKANNFTFTIVHGVIIVLLSIVGFFSVSFMSRSDENDNKLNQKVEMNSNSINDLDKIVIEIKINQEIIKANQKEIQINQKNQEKILEQLLIEIKKK